MSRPDPSPSQSQQHEDQRIGHFIVKAEIGKGSFAVVHKGFRVASSSLQKEREGRELLRDGRDDRRPSANSPNLRSPVAIKIVTRKKLTPKLLDNLEGEIAILRAISHPNIVELKDCLKTDAYIYLVMEFCSAGDLSLYIKKRGALPSNSEPIYNSQNLHHSSSSSLSASYLSGSRDLEPTREYPHPEDGGLNEVITRSFLAQLASALEFMRAKNIVHRDIKPQNLLLQPPDRNWIEMGHERDIPQLKVADFGFARNLPAASLAETLCGSPLYMAPEILRYEKYDAKADLWSVGAVLFEMCVGKPPFRAANHVELLKKIERGEDRIKFPDERSAGSLQREADRRAKDGERPLPHPHLVSNDLKDLIRLLLRKKPVERGSFEELFNGEICRAFSQETTQRLEEREKRKRRKADQAIEEEAGKGTQGSGSNGSNQSLQSSSIPSSSEEPLPASQLPTSSSPSSPITPRTFTSKYVVGDGGSLRDQRRAEPLTQVRTNLSGSEGNRSGIGRGEASPSSLDDPAVLTPSSSLTNVQTTVPATGPPNASQSQGLAPADADSFLGKEYVMVDKGNVEVNALADELALASSPNSNPRSPNSALVRRPSRLRSGGSTSSIPGNSSSPSNTFTTGIGVTPGILSSSPLATLPNRSPTGTTPPTNAPFALPAGSRPTGFNRRTSLSSSGSPSPRLTSQNLAGGASGTTPPSGGEDVNAMRVISGGGAGIANPSRGGISLSSSPSYSNIVPTPANPPSSALARAISMASVRLFGVPSGMSLRSAASLVRNRGNRRSTLIRSGEHPDSQEANLLLHLEDLAEKSWVLAECADSKMSNFFPTGPHQVGSLTDLETSSHSNFGSIGRAGSQVISTTNRRSVSSGSSVLSGGGLAEAESAAAEAYVLYVKSLSFLQRGIQATKLFTDSRARQGSPPVVSADVSDLVQWLRARFNETFEKATFAGGKFGEQLSETAQDLEKLIYDKALEVAKAAALDELENNRDGAGWDPNNCLLAYETALTMLEGLLDPGEDGRSLPENEVGQVRQFIVSIEKRLEGLRRRLSFVNRFHYHNPLFIFPLVHFPSQYSNFNGLHLSLLFSITLMLILEVCSSHHVHASFGRHLHSHSFQQPPLKAIHPVFQSCFSSTFHPKLHSGSPTIPFHLFLSLDFEQTKTGI